MIAFLLLLSAGLVFYLVYQLGFKKKWISPDSPFPTNWRLILVENINFYNSLNKDEKVYFEFEIQEFLLNCKITGIDIEVDITDKLLIASSAIIPVFSFPEWKYTNLVEILLYEDHFDEKFQTEGEGKCIYGMVGYGFMDGKMALSKKALHHGFDNKSDKRNTAVHEFIHLIDKMDGVVDGIPHELLDKQYVLPWVELMENKVKEIYAQKSDINPYAGTNRAEFYAVISEYFFERPKLLEKKHPGLYSMLENIFSHDMADRKLNHKKYQINRNSKCPCNSGLKFKKCCGSIHFNN